MRHFIAVLLMIALSPMLTQGTRRHSEKIVVVVKEEDPIDKQDIDSLARAIYKTGDSIARKNRVSKLIIESQKKTLELEIDILKKQNDILKAELDKYKDLSQKFYTEK